MASCAGAATGAASKASVAEELAGPSIPEAPVPAASDTEEERTDEVVKQETPGELATPDKLDKIDEANANQVKPNESDTPAKPEKKDKPDQADSQGAESKVDMPASLEELEKLPDKPAKELPPWLQRRPRASKKKVEE